MKKKPQAETQGRQVRAAKPKAGLSFSERKRLMELKRTLSGNSKKQEKPTTAQNTITFKKMFQDGICQVTSTFYTKMVEFFDINYDLLEIEDQGEILEEYSKLINYFDPSIKFELFLFNRQVNEQTLIEQFDIPLQGDEFDDIREEYTEMLKKQAAKGNNGIIKSKYLIFGIECKGFKEARAKLASIEADVIKNFLNLGTHARSLDGKERLRILHEYFNQDTMEPFRFSFKELSESGKSVKDYIAPPGFDFRYPSRFKAGKMYGSVHYLDIIAPRFNDELLKKLLDIDDNLTITMHMQTFDPVKAMEILDACAAPGGKSAAIIAATGGKARLTATDLHKHRLPILKENLDRQGSPFVRTAQADWSLPCRTEWKGRFDAVLLDVPCSNTGVIQRRVDVRWRLTPEEIRRLAALQKTILENASRAVKPGGRLVYSTCSIDAEEDGLLVRDFLQNHPEWTLKEEKLILPHEEKSDGAYAALLICA